MYMAQQAIKSSKKRNANGFNRCKKYKDKITN